jgi:N-acetylglutamate synthase-like GNAT family acetyltransferase
MNSVKQASSKNEIEAIIQLRYKILRQPWNKSIETATDELEMESVNAFISNPTGEVIACGRLQNNGLGVGQIRYMAVDENFQGQGLGKVICHFLETKAIEMGLTQIELQARENAVGFYKSLGYSIKEKSFILWDIIQHYLMVKDIK